MNRFAADHFWKTATVLSNWKNDPKITQSPSFANDAVATIGIFVEQLNELGLPVSIREIQKLSTWLSDSHDEVGALPIGRNKLHAYEKLNIDVCNRIDAVMSVVHSELESSFFYHMPIDRKGYLNKPDIFGNEVLSKFPAVQFDIVEAGNCFAMGRGTATVFHLMRVMEAGVQSFGTKLGVAITKGKNWQNILDEINKAIKALPQKDPATIALHQTSANLYSVKVAWRNEVMHPSDTYTLEEAENILRQVKIFMQQLASIV